MCGGTKKVLNYDAETICVKAIRPGLPDRLLLRVDKAQYGTDTP